MFPSQRSMELSTILGKHSWELMSKVARVQDAAQRTSGEVKYFRSLFPQLLLALDKTRVDDLYIQCKAREVHHRAMVRYGRSKRCELGDYFLNVKYYDDGKLLGRKLVVYQFKWGRDTGSTRSRAKRSWHIDDKQLTLLRDWPTFVFGNTSSGYNTFTLSPRTAELGSYWLADTHHHPCLCPYIPRHYLLCCCCGISDVVCPAIGISVDLNGHSVSESFSPGERGLGVSAACAIAMQLLWQYGELVETGTRMHDFLDALYRFVGLAPDPPGEFDGFTSEGGHERPYWGFEISVTRERPSRRE